MEEKTCRRCNNLKTNELYCGKAKAMCESGTVMRTAAIIACSIFLLAGCGRKIPTQPPPPGDKTVIKGIITDSLSGQPLQYAWVSINGNGGTSSGANGAYRLVGMGGGTFTVTAAKVDWRPNSAGATVAANDSVAVNIKMHPRQWEMVDIPLSTPWSLGYMESVCFINDNEGWAVCSDDQYAVPGCIIHTTDGGYHWTMQYGAAPVDAHYFKKIDFVDKYHGWAGGSAMNKIKVTYDGGLNWLDTIAPATSFWLFDFIDPTTGWLASWTDGSIFKTIDGGTSWAKVATLPEVELTYMKFIDANTGWIRSSTKIYGTTNGGNTWTAQLSVPIGAYPYTKIAAVAPSDVWIEGYHSNNGGISWVHQPSDTFGPITSISFCTPQYGWMAGTSAMGNRNYMIHTTDGGSTWKKVWESTNVYYIFDMQFLSPSLGWAVTKRGAGNQIILIYK